MDNLPLHFAARNRSLFHFKRVMKTDDEKRKRRKDEITALYHAASKGRLDVIKYLMNIINEKGPHDRYGNSPLEFAVTYEHLEVCQYLMENNNAIYKNAKEKSVLAWEKEVKKMKICENCFYFCSITLGR